MNSGWSLSLSLSLWEDHTCGTVPVPLLQVWYPNQQKGGMHIVEYVFVNVWHLAQSALSDKIWPKFCSKKLEGGEQTFHFS